VNMASSERSTLLSHDYDEENPRVVWFFNVRRKKLRNNGARFLAEMIGTLFLTFVATLTLMLPIITSGESDLQLTSIAISLAITGLTFALSHISGAHFNPVVSFAFALRREFKWWRLPFYWAAQIIGAIVAGGLLYWHFEYLDAFGPTVPRFIDSKRAFGLETLFTMSYVFVVLYVSERGRLKGTNAALATGAVVGMNTLLGCYLTGASMNPARSFGAVIYSSRHAWKQFWIYLVGPFFGAFLAVCLSYFLNPYPLRLTRKQVLDQGIVVQQPPPTLASE